MADSQAGEAPEGAPPTVTDRATFDRSTGPLARVEALRPLALKHSATVKQKVYDEAIAAGDDHDTACRNAKIARNKAYLTALGLQDGAPKLQTPRQTRPRGPPAEPREGDRKSARLKDGLPADYSGELSPEVLELMRKRERAAVLLEEAGMTMDDEPEEEQQEEEEEEAEIPDVDEDEYEDEDEDDDDDDEEEEDAPPARIAADAPRAMPVKAPGKKKAAPRKHVARDIEASPEEEAEDGNVWELRPGEDQEAFVARLMAEMEKDAGKKKAASRKRVACDIVASPEEEEDDVWKRRPGEDDQALIARLEAEIASRSEDGCKKKQRRKVGGYHAAVWAATKTAGSGASRSLRVEVVGDAPIRGFEDISLDSVTQALYGPAAPYNGSAARLYQNEGARNYPRQTLGNGMRGWPRQLGDRGCVGDLRKPDYVFIQELPNQGDVHVFIQEAPPKKKQRGGVPTPSTPMVSDGGPTPSTPMVSDDTEDEPEAGHCTIC